MDISYRFEETVNAIFGNNTFKFSNYCDHHADTSFRAILFTLGMHERLYSKDKYNDDEKKYLSEYEDKFQNKTIQYSDDVELLKFLYEKNIGKWS